ncbi:glycerophosphodiester phosphodiesterase family protein [Virgibacillus sp. YIM 98842]|uniref:glycerophosphodiester phosphodiesterase n=1 Tax=Virgibacillus sp. YIM 98842 TaxID=2663533 RepID=UPI0013DC423C|nr:glycerophosphodiester phosphodiesterase family protein [Virgibacillus sp. YIM 98842]
MNNLVLNFAHRGSLTEAPENTLPAMQKALDHNIRGIELDVQLTRDNKLVVIHDQELARFNKMFPGYVKDYTLKEIKQIDIGSSFSEEFTGVSLATLDEILEILPENILLNVEIKNIPIVYKGIEQAVTDCLKNHKFEDRVIVSSFDHEALKNFQELNPDIPIGLLFYYRLLKPWEYARYCGLDIYSIHPMQNWTDRKLIEECHSLGYKVFPYTVNSESRYEQLLDYGVDGVFSNNPDIFTKL